MRPKKSLSQNFLCDLSVVDRIVKFANVQPCDTILEIGPGTGVLTKALLSCSKMVIAVEKDDRLIPGLRQKFPSLQLIHGDILNLNLDYHLPVTHKVKVVANLPYSLTSPILGHLLPRHDRIETVTVMVQLEVAKRLVAHPGDSDFSALTLFAQTYTTPTLGFTVSKVAFNPVPKVDSAVVHFALHPPQIRCHLPTFFNLIKTAFSQRRKMVRKTLKESIPQGVIDQILIEHNLPIEARPGTIPIECFSALARIKEDQS